MGTLRCIQAVVKMQALVRARRARLSLEGLSIQEKHDWNLKTDHQRANPLVMLVLLKKRRLVLSRPFLLLTLLLQTQWPCLAQALSISVSNLVTIA